MEKTQNRDLIDAESIPKEENGILSRRQFLTALLASAAVSTLPEESAAGEESMKHERPNAITTWQEVDGKSFIKDVLPRIQSGEKVALIVGAEWCIPCKDVMQWWSTRNIGPFQPIYMNAKDNKDLSRVLESGVLNGVQFTAMPALLIFDGTKTLKYAVGYFACTGADNGIAQWLNEGGF